MLSIKRKLTLSTNLRKSPPLCLFYCLLFGESFLHKTTQAMWQSTVLNLLGLLRNISFSSLCIIKGHLRLAEQTSWQHGSSALIILNGRGNECDSEHFMQLSYFTINLNENPDEQLPAIRQWGMRGRNSSLQVFCFWFVQVY